MKLLKLLPVFLMVFVCVPAFAQNKIIDSLKHRLATAASDKEKAKLYNDIAIEYEEDPALMIQYAKKALALASQKHIMYPQGTAWVSIGNANIILSKYTEALKSFTNAQIVYEEMLKTADKKDVNDIKDGLGRAYGSIGVVCSEQNNYAKALEYYFKALKIYEDIKEEEIVAIASNNIGAVYEAQKEYSKALEYFTKAQWIQKKTGDFESLGITVTNIGKIYLFRNEFDKAFKAFSEAEKILKEHNKQRGLAELYNNIGDYYIKKDNYTEAEKNYSKALAIFNQTGEKLGASASLGSLGSLYALQNNNALAIKNLQLSAALAT
ncbi:MAG: tetratricopeptide repeat protein, partial [Sphingobacteriales bacterium]